MKSGDIIGQIRKLCPEEYAASWDNTGLLVGSMKKEVRRVLLALDATDEAIEQAASCGADMLLTHHPMIFSPVKSVTEDTLEGRRIIRLIENGITYYASHTNFDVCCMADEAARLIGMKDGVVLEKTTEIDGKAAGFGKAADMPPAAVGEWADRIKEIFGLDYVIVYGDVQKEVRRVAISPGSGKGMLEQCMAVGAELFISGDIGHHDAIDSAAMGCAVIDAGHYGLEHIYMNYMKQYLEPLCEGVEFFTFEQGCPGVSR